MRADAQGQLLCDRCGKPAARLDLDQRTTPAHHFGPCCKHKSQCPACRKWVRSQVLQSRELWPLLERLYGKAGGQPITTLCARCSP